MRPKTCLSLPYWQSLLQTLAKHVWERQSIPPRGQDIPDVITGGPIVSRGYPSVQRQIPNYLGLGSTILELRFFKLWFLWSTGQNMFFWFITLQLPTCNMLICLFRIHRLKLFTTREPEGCSCYLGLYYSLKIMVTPTSFYSNFQCIILQKQLVFNFNLHI